MKFILLIYLLIAISLSAEELTVVADTVEGDELKGVSFLKGNVRMNKGKDELNASCVYIYTNRERKPIKYSAEGNVSFKIVLESGAIYQGQSDRVEFHPDMNEYRFFDHVKLEQLDEKKVIIGEKVIVNVNSGTALAEGSSKKPVRMIFNIKDKNSTKGSK